MEHNPRGAGKSSFDLIDSNKLFSQLNLKDDSVIVDLGCGKGNYSLAISNHIGESGCIYAIDLWKEGIDELNKTIENKGIKNIKPIVSDISRKFPIEDNTVDICFIATVFHDLVEDGNHNATLFEIKRVLKDNGKLAIIEFKKMDGPPGPPIKVRISEDELEKMICSFGFKNLSTIEIGNYNYLSIFGLR